MRLDEIAGLTFRPMLVSHLPRVLRAQEYNHWMEHQ
jgi:hypothetical protein